MDGNSWRPMKGSIIDRDFPRILTHSGGLFFGWYAIALDGRAFLALGCRRGNPGQGCAGTAVVHLAEQGKGGRPNSQIPMQRARGGQIIGP